MSSYRHAPSQRRRARHRISPPVYLFIWPPVPSPPHHHPRHRYVHSPWAWLERLLRMATSLADIVHQLRR